MPKPKRSPMKTPPPRRWPARRRRKTCRGSRSIRHEPSEIAFATLAAGSAPDAAAARRCRRLLADPLHVGHDGARRRACHAVIGHERAGALAHVAQNLYRHGERTLGVMPLYHTMGVRSLLSMAMVDGLFVCVRRWNSRLALESISKHAESVALYLVPTLYHDLLADEAEFAESRYLVGHEARLRRRSDERRPVVSACRPRSSLSYSSTTTARPRSIRSASTRTR